jgi:hypothetical protein
LIVSKNLKGRGNAWARSSLDHFVGQIRVTIAYRAENTAESIGI